MIETLVGIAGAVGAVVLLVLAWFAGKYQRPRRARTVLPPPLPVVQFKRGLSDAERDQLGRRLQAQTELVAGTRSPLLPHPGAEA